MSCGDFSTVHWGLSTHPPLLLSWSFCPWTSIDFHTDLSPHMLCAEEFCSSGMKTRLEISILASKKMASVPLQRHLCICLWSSLGRHLCASSGPHQGHMNWPVRSLPSTCNSSLADTIPPCTGNEPQACCLTLFSHTTSLSASIC